MQEEFRDEFRFKNWKVIENFLKAVKRFDDKRS